MQDTHVRLFSLQLKATNKKDTRIKYVKILILKITLVVVQQYENFNLCAFLKDTLYCPHKYVQSPGMHV